MDKIYIILLILLILLLIKNMIKEQFTHKKVALCFFGICRSTQYTIESINKYIYSALDNLNIEYDIYLHTYNIDTEYVNKWANETGLKINNDNYKLLNANYISIENDSDISKELELHKYRSHGDPWSNIRYAKGDTEFITLNNAIKGMYSIYQVTKMWKNTGIKYDGILYLRPDVLYLQPLTLEYLNLIQENTIVIPNFAEFPINDKFAMGSPDVMEKYGNRYLDAYEYSLLKQLHTETYLNHILNKNKIKIKKIYFNFCRIKPNGENRDPELL